MWPFNRSLNYRLTILERTVRIMAKTQAELAQDLRDLTAQVSKVNGETQGLQTEVNTLKTKVADLEAALNAGGNASQEVLDAFAGLKTQVQAVDDAVPDVVTPPSP